MIVCNDSNSEDCPPEMRCPGHDGKRPNLYPRVMEQEYILDSKSSARKGLSVRIASRGPVSRSIRQIGETVDSGTDYNYMADQFSWENKGFVTPSREIVPPIGLHII